MPVKAFIIAGVILGLMGFAYWYGDRNYDAGYNAHKAEQFDATEKAVSAAETRVSDELKKVIAQKEVERKAALTLVNRLRRIKNKVVYREIEILSTPNCTHLGGDFVQLFNNIIGEPPISGPTGGSDGLGSHPDPP